MVLVHGKPLAGMACDTGGVCVVRRTVSGG